MPRDLTVDKPILVQVMAWYHQTTNHHLYNSVTRGWWVRNFHVCLFLYFLFILFYFLMCLLLSITFLDCTRAFQFIVDINQLCVNIQCLSVLNSLWPSDAIKRHRSGSTLVQVIDGCLTASSHNLNRCWLIIIRSSDVNLMAISQEIP